MYDPAMRVLTVLELLQAHESVTGAMLAEHLEVSPRTVQRYIARLQDLGVPVKSTRGPGGAYRLRPGFRLPPLMFGAEEAFALVLGLDALAYLGIAQIAPATVGAKAKLQRVLPEAIAERVRAVHAALVLDAPRMIVETDVATLATLASAIAASRSVMMAYKATDGDLTVRTIDPLGLMQHEGRWFLAAHCQLRQGPRLFRVDRITSLDQSGSIFAPPTNFDVRAFIYERIALAHARWEIDLWLDLAPEVVEARLPRAMAILEVADEGTRLRCTATDLEDIAEVVLALRCRIVVRSPAELVTAFRSVAERALAVMLAAS